MAVTWSCECIGSRELQRERFARLGCVWMGNAGMTWWIIEGSFLVKVQSSVAFASVYTTSKIPHVPVFMRTSVIIFFWMHTIGSVGLEL
jgi:hypothetical protein